MTSVVERRVTQSTGPGGRSTGGRGSVDGGEQEREGELCGQWSRPRRGLVQARCRVHVKGCSGCSGDGLPETMGFTSSDGHMQSWFVSSHVEVMTV